MILTLKSIWTDFSTLKTQNTTNKINYYNLVKSEKIN